MLFRNLLLIAILFVNSLCELAVIKKQKDKILPGNVFMETSSPSWSLCAELCSRLAVCQSINFIARNKTCQVNDAAPDGCTRRLIDSPGNSFIAASTFPKVRKLLIFINVQILY